MEKEILELSTGNITQKDMTLLETRYDLGFSIAKFQYGVFFIAPTAKDTREALRNWFSDSFMKVIDHCYENGIMYVVLDCDAVEDERFDHHEW